MYLKKHRQKQAANTVWKRILALTLTIALLLGLIGTVPGIWRSPLLTEVDAASNFTYEPNSMGAAVLPKDDVLSMKAVQALEAANPSVVLDINSKFAWSINSEHTGYGSKDWKADYPWSPKEDQKIKEHLLNQAMDLEVLWTGSYRNNPSVKIWYDGNRGWLEYGRLYDFSDSVGFNLYREEAKGKFSSNTDGVLRNGSTGAIPLSYKRKEWVSRTEIEYDEKGRPRYDENGKYIRHDTSYIEHHIAVVGDKMVVRNWENGGNRERITTPLHVTLSGDSSASVSNTKMRLRDKTSPFLNRIRLKKNGQDMSGDVYVKNGDNLDVVLEFNEDIRFADNDPTDHDLRLRLTFVDQSNGVSDTDSWVEANLVSIKGKTMTFRFDPANSRSGKTLPAEYYVDGIASRGQTGWFSDNEAFWLCLIDANGATVRTEAFSSGIVTDLAGNPFESFNVTRFEDNAKATYDRLPPSIYKTVIWTSNFGEEEAGSGLNPNEIEPEKLYLKEGDKVNLKIIFSEEMNTKDGSLADNNNRVIDSVATLNVMQNGSAVTVEPSKVGKIYSKTIDVNAASRMLTVIEYKPLTVESGMTLNGGSDFLNVTAISGLNNMCDLSLNTVEDTTIRLVAQQQRIDTIAPEIQVGRTVDDTLDPDVFTVPFSITDEGSGLSKIWFRIYNDNACGDFLWMVDSNETVVRRESDNKTADTSDWARASTTLDPAKRDEAYKDRFGWQDISVVSGTQNDTRYLHIKLLDTDSKIWGYRLSEAPGEASNTKKTVTDIKLQIRASDLKKNEKIEESDRITHGVGRGTKTVISFSGITYETGKATISVKVKNPMGVQRIVWGTAQNLMNNEVYTGDLQTEYSFNIEQQTDVSGTITLFVGAYGPAGTPQVGTASWSYNYSAGTLSYEKSLGDEKAPLFGLPVIDHMSVTDNNRVMVLIDKGDGSFYATAGSYMLNYTNEQNLFEAKKVIENLRLTWYTLTGTAANDYSSLEVSGMETTDALAVETWLKEYYGKVTIVLLNQNKSLSNGDGGWNDTYPGSYSANNGITCAVEYAYLANGAAFEVTPGVVYAKTGESVPANVLSGSPAEPHDDIADYLFNIGLTNTRDEGSNQSYGLRVVEYAEAELFYSSDGTTYESVRKVEVPVGSSISQRFSMEDEPESGSENEPENEPENGSGDEAEEKAVSGWYKVVYRYKVNGVTTETVVAEDIYLDNTSAVTPDIVSYERSFDLWVREPKWKYGAYFVVDHSNYKHHSVASDGDIGDGDIVKIGVAPIEVPKDIMANGAELNPPGGNDINNDPQYLNRYYLADNEVNDLTFSVTKTAPKAGTAENSRIGGENHFYAWSGNDPDGRASAKANWITVTPGTDITLTAADGTNGFDYTGGKLPLTDGYNQIHYVVEYADGETVEKEFMADVRTKAMNLSLDIYYHAKDQYINADTLNAEWELHKSLTDEDGYLLYPTQEDYLNSIGVVQMEVISGYNYLNRPIYEEAYVVVGPKCTDEADLLHRNEAVVNPVLNDYDTALASSFMAYRHLDGENLERTWPERQEKLNPMGEERFRRSSENELFFAEDVYGNVSFASLSMDAIDGEAPELSFSSSFDGTPEYSDITRGSYYGATGFDFLLDMKDDNPLNLSKLTVSFDPAYSKVLDPQLDGDKETLTMELPLNFEQDEMGYYLPWEISESEAGKTGGITMTCLKMNLNANPNAPEHNVINGVEIQGAFKPCNLPNGVTMTFSLTDAYGNEGTASIIFPNNEEVLKLNSETITLKEGVRDNEGWYTAKIDKKADGSVIDVYYPGYNELPDWAPEPQYSMGTNEGYEDKKISIDDNWRYSVMDILPELDFYNEIRQGDYFTNDGYVKVGIVRESQAADSWAEYLPHALSVESYETDYGVFTDGYVRTRTFEKLTGRYGDSASYYQTEQALILPSVTENGDVTVIWTDVFGDKHTNTVTITAFGTATNSDMDVRATFSNQNRTNEDVLVSLKGGRRKVVNGDTIESTTTCVITGINVKLLDGTTFDQTDSRVGIYASQPWNATVLMPSNGIIEVEYRYPNYNKGFNDDTAEPNHYKTGSRTFRVNNIDKTPPVTTVSYIYADNGEEIDEGVTTTTREIRAVVSADKPIEGVDGSLSYVFTYGTALGTGQTFTVCDKAGNTAEVTAVCPAAISEPEQVQENKAPTATVYLSANLNGVSKNIGIFKLSENGVTQVLSDDGETMQSVNINEEAVAAINKAIEDSIATLYTLRFEIIDEYPAACTITSSNPGVASVGANNTVTVRTNGEFSLTVSDNVNNTSSFNNIVVGSLDTEAPEVTASYGLYTAEDGTPRVRVAFKPENDEVIYPIVTGDQNSRDILSTVYNLYGENKEEVIGQRTGYFIDFERNEDYTFYYRDIYGNASSVSVRVRGIDTKAPVFTSIKWNGTVNSLTPDTAGAGPTAKNVSATIKTDKALSAAAMYYYDEDTENHVGDELSEEDAGKVSLDFSTNMIEVTWKDNLDRPLILSAKSVSSGQTGYYELPAIGVIDKTPPTVALSRDPVLSDDKASKEFRFTVSGSEGEVFTSNLAVTYTTEGTGEEERVIRNAIGVKGTEFIYTATSSTPVTLHFTDDAGNSTEYTLTAEMLAGIDAVTLSVRYNTVDSDEGATNNLSELELRETTLYVYTNKNAKVTLIDDSSYDPETTVPDPSKVWNVSAKTWTAVTISNTADIQALRFDDLNTEKRTYVSLVSKGDRIAPAISYTGEDTVFATTDMTPAEIQTLMLSDVSAYDAVDGPIDKATITVSGCSALAGLHTVTYKASDQAGNEAKIERNLYVKGKYDPIIKVNGKDTVPLQSTVVKTRQINLTASCALEGDSSVYLAIRPGIMTAARMKYSTDSGTNSLSYTAPTDGFYTVLARNRDRTEVLIYIYVDESH